jgi:hypothetical protein
MKIKERSKQLNDILKYERKVLGGILKPDVKILNTINEINEQRVEYIKDWNEAVDKRCLDIIHKWGEEYEIEELKNFNFSMGDIEIRRIIDKYDIKTSVIDHGLWGKTAFLCMRNHSALPREIIYVIETDETKYVVEEN